MIRPATVNDIRPIYDMMAAYHREYVDRFGHNLDWNQESAVIYLGSILWSKDGMNFITERQEGIVLGSINETWFGKNRVAKPAVLYVKPEHRNGLIARALLRRFEAESKARGAFGILWEFESGLSDGKMLGGMMEKLGYEYQGPIYKKILGG